MTTPPNMVYLPDLAEGRLVRYYHFRHPQSGPSSCVLVSDCKANSPNLQYAYVLYVYEGGDFLTGRPCFAVASEVNRVAPVGSGRSHFLGVFPGGQQHINLGASDDWADIQKFTPRALEIIVEHFSLSSPPQEAMVPTVMLQRFRVPRSYVLASSTPPPPPPPAPAKKWWEFWKS